MYLILAIIIFGVFIAIHEFGHFIAAKACGVRVNEFSIGMGPAIWKKQKGETLYALRVLPLGGYCAMEGEEGESDDERSFQKKSRPKRFVILAAGAVMNFLLGIVLIMVTFIGVESFAAPVITGFLDGCPYEGDFQVGDRFYRINGERIYFTGDVSTYLARNGGSNLMDITVIRDGEKVEFEDYEMTPAEYEQDGEKVMLYGFYMQSTESGPLAFLKYSWYQALDFVRLVRIGLVDLVTGGAAMSDMAGVVGIVDMMQTVGSQAPSVAVGVQNVLYIGALIAVNLAVMNLLPIPGLDGGQIMFLVLTWIIERFTRRKLDPKYVGYVNAAGLILLMGLMVVVMYNDIARIISG